MATVRTLAANVGQAFVGQGPIAAAVAQTARRATALVTDTVLPAAGSALSQTAQAVGNAPGALGAIYEAVAPHPFRHATEVVTEATSGVGDLIEQAKAALQEVLQEFVHSSRADILAKLRVACTPESGDEARQQAVSQARTLLVAQRSKIEPRMTDATLPAPKREVYAALFRSYTQILRTLNLWVHAQPLPSIEQIQAAIAQLESALPLPGSLGDILAQVHAQALRTIEAGGEAAKAQINKQPSPQLHQLRSALRALMKKIEAGETITLAARKTVLAYIQAYVDTLPIDEVAQHPDNRALAALRGDLSPNEALRVPHLTAQEALTAIEARWNQEAGILFSTLHSDAFLSAVRQLYPDYEADVDLEQTSFQQVKELFETRNAAIEIKNQLFLLGGLGVLNKDQRFRYRMILRYLRRAITRNDLAQMKLWALRAKKFLLEAENCAGFIKHRAQHNGLKNHPRLPALLTAADDTTKEGIAARNELSKLIAEHAEKRALDQIAKQGQKLQANVQGLLLGFLFSWYGYIIPAGDAKDQNAVYALSVKMTQASRPLVTADEGFDKEAIEKDRKEKIRLLKELLGLHSDTEAEAIIDSKLEQRELFRRIFFKQIDKASPNKIIALLSKLCYYLIGTLLNFYLSAFIDNIFTDLQLGLQTNERAYFQSVTTSVIEKLGNHFTNLNKEWKEVGEGTDKHATGSVNKQMDVRMQKPGHYGDHTIADIYDATTNVIVDRYAPSLHWGKDIGQLATKGVQRLEKFMLESSSGTHKFIASVRKVLLIVPFYLIKLPTEWLLVPVAQLAAGIVGSSLNWFIHKLVKYILRRTQTLTLLMDSTSSGLGIGSRYTHTINSLLLDQLVGLQKMMSTSALLGREAVAQENQLATEEARPVAANLLQALDYQNHSATTASVHGVTAKSRNEDVWGALRKAIKEQTGVDLAEKVEDAVTAQVAALLTLIFQKKQFNELILTTLTSVNENVFSQSDPVKESEQKATADRMQGALNEIIYQSISLAIDETYDPKDRILATAHQFMEKLVALGNSALAQWRTQSAEQIRRQFESDGDALLAEFNRVNPTNTSDDLKAWFAAQSRELKERLESALTTESDETKRLLQEWLRAPHTFEYGQSLGLLRTTKDKVKTEVSNEVTKITDGIPAFLKQQHNTQGIAAHFFLDYVTKRGYIWPKDRWFFTRLFA